MNLIMRGRDGGWRRRYDLAYEHLRLIIEYDGRKHAEDARGTFKPEWRLHFPTH